MNIKTLSAQLKEDGWHLKEEFLEEFLQNQPNLKYNEIIKCLLDADLKDVGSVSISSEVKKGNQFPTPVVLQVTNVRNIAAPKSNEESGAAPRMLRLTLTDGIGFINGIEFSTIKNFGGETPPGTKVKLLSKVSISSGYLLLTPSNTVVLGGIVEELFDKWKFSQSISKYSRMTFAADGSGPPPWVPFGHKIIDSKDTNGVSNQKTTSESSKTKANDEFEIQRNQVVKELAKGSTTKVFGGGKQMLDSNVQKIVNNGFTIEEAEWALKKCRHDPSRALKELRMLSDGGNAYSNPPSTQQEPTHSHKGGRGGRGKGKGRGKDLGPDGSDEDTPQMAKMRPSGPASLSDFLESKILEKKETVNFHNDRDGRGNKRGSASTRASKNNAPANSNESWPVVGETPVTVVPSPYSQQIFSQEQPYYESSQKKSSYQGRGRGRQNYYGQQHYQDRASQYTDSHHQRSYHQYGNEQNRQYNSNNYYPDKYRQDPPPRFSDKNSYHGNQQSSRGGNRGRGYNRYQNNQHHSQNQQSDHQNAQHYNRDRYNQHQDDRGYSNQYTQQREQPERSYTADERDLIARFQQSMILSGHYEAEHFSSQNQNATRNTAPRSLEYRRGGDGYARRGSERGSRGRRSRY